MPSSPDGGKQRWKWVSSALPSVVAIAAIVVSGVIATSQQGVSLYTSLLPYKQTSFADFLQSFADCWDSARMAGLQFDYGVNAMVPDSTAYPTQATKFKSRSEYKQDLWDNIRVMEYSYYRSVPFLGANETRTEVWDYVWGFENFCWDTADSESIAEVAASSGVFQEYRGNLTTKLMVVMFPELAE